MAISHAHNFNMHEYGIHDPPSLCTVVHVLLCGRGTCVPRPLVVLKIGVWQHAVGKSRADGQYCCAAGIQSCTSQRMWYSVFSLVVISDFASSDVLAW